MTPSLARRRLVSLRIPLRYCLAVLGTVAAAGCASRFGMSLVFSNPNITTNNAQLNIATPPGTPPGTYPIVIHGNSFPLGEQLVSLDVVVVAPGESAGSH